MPSMMAIVSKAIFEKDARGKAVGDVWATDRYTSQNKQLGQLAGGDLYLVTVRPGDTLWLVAVLAKPTFADARWRAQPNAQPIRDISALRSKLKFANGQGLPSKPGALGMSLQTPRVLTADDLALLGIASTPVETHDIDEVEPAGLEGVLAHVRAGHLDAALEGLLEVWATSPHPRVAELIAVLSTSARTPTPANVRGKTAAARAAWDEHAARARAVDVPMLLESLVDVSSGDALERLLVVGTWLPDPRIDAAFVSILEAVPYRATSTQPFWRKLFPLLREISDPAQLPRIEAITFDGVAATMAEFLRTQRNKLVGVLAPKFGAAVAAPPLLDEIAAAIGGAHVEGAADRASIDELLRAVYETPADDGPRTVLADALIERNDPRGEFISVQLRLAHTPDDRALRQREKELLEMYGRGWLGELAPIVMADYRFERGFLAACKLDNARLDRVRKLVGHPAWSTVIAIEGSALIALDPVMRSLRALGFDQGNARRHEQLPNAWRDLLVDTPRAIEELRYENLASERQWLDTVEGRRQISVSDQSEVDALCHCAALPSLRRLAIRDQPILVIGKLVRAPVLDRLDRLAFIYDRNNRFDQSRSSPLVDFAQLLVEHRVPTVAFEIGTFHETELVLERGTRGYERARMLVGPTLRSNWSTQLVDEAIRILDTLPKTVRELRLVTRIHTESQQVARLRAAATQLGLALVE